MRSIVKFFLDRPIVVHFVVLVMLLLGVFSALESRKEGFPQVSMNTIIISSIYPGASPVDVELNVTNKIEDALKEVESIEEVTSVSKEGISTVQVRVDDNATADEFKKVYDDVENVIAQIDDFPEELDGKPTLESITSQDRPIIEVGFAGSYEVLKPYMEHLERKLRKVAGVAFVDSIGLPDRELQVLIDPRKARQNTLGLGQIATAIQNRNQEGSGGTLESFIGQKKVVSYNKFEDTDDLLRSNVRRSAEGYGVRLGQVADAQIIPKDINLWIRNNGRAGAFLVAKQNANADVVDTVEAIKELLAKEDLPAGVSMKVFADGASFTKRRLQLLFGNTLMGFALVLVILFLVLNPRTAIWTAFGMVFSMLGVFVFLYSSGFTLNMISLGGFVMVIGMVVDDAIVIAEEVNSNKEKGLPAKEAAMEAVGKMWRPVTGAALTTMVAFSPIVAMGGLPGKFVWIIPVIVIVALAVSLFESFFILPAHLIHGKEKKQEKKKFIIKSEELYEKLLHRVFRLRYGVFGIITAILVGSAIALNVFVDKDPFPQEAAEEFFVKLTFPKGSSAQFSQKKIKKVEKILDQLPQEELIGYNSRIGTHSESKLTDRGSLENLAIVFVYLTPYGERERSIFPIVKQVRQAMKQKFSNGTEFEIDLKRTGPPLGKPYEVRVSSFADDKRAAKVQEIKNYLQGVDGVQDIENDRVEGKNELKLMVNYDRLARTGVSVAELLKTIRIAYDGMVVSSIRQRNEDMDIRVRLNESARSDESFITQLPIANHQGQLIRLSNIVWLKETKAQGEIRHLDGMRTTTIYGTTDAEKITPVKLLEKVKDKFASNQEVQISYAGQPVETQKIFDDMAMATTLALLGVFLLLSLVLNSFRRPFMIILTIPFIVIGIALVILTHGLPMSIFAGISLIGLIGVVVNDSIVMSENIDYLKSRNSETGELTEEVIKEGAVERLRPIFLTTVTTFFALLPTGYGIGGYDPFLSQMTLIMSYGLFFASAMVLIMLPLYHRIAMDLQGLKARLPLLRG